MQFVGFPNGLIKTDEEMRNWFTWIESNRPVLNHYSIFEDGKYCGESFYEIDEEQKSAALDIKLFGFVPPCKGCCAAVSARERRARRRGPRVPDEITSEPDMRRRQFTCPRRNSFIREKRSAFLRVHLIHRKRSPFPTSGGRLLGARSPMPPLCKGGDEREDCRAHCTIHVHIALETTLPSRFAIHPPF